MELHSFLLLYYWECVSLYKCIYSHRNKSEVPIHSDTMAKKPKPKRWLWIFNHVGGGWGRGHCDFSWLPSHFWVFHTSTVFFSYMWWALFINMTPSQAVPLEPRVHTEAPSPSYPTLPPKGMASQMGALLQNIAWETRKSSSCMLVLISLLASCPPLFFPPCQFLNTFPPPTYSVPDICSPPTPNSFVLSLPLHAFPQYTQLHCC